MTAKQLSVADFLNEAGRLPVIDVRSPGEYVHAHIPHAINIPLFDNDERAKVGTKYKHAGKDAAVLLGLELVGPKLAGFVKQVRRLNPEGKEVLVHCWRGGMRSGSFAWLLNTAGIRARTLEGGYKAYRSEVLSAFAQPRQLMILGGKTGSGKTDILKELARQGEQVIDLEAIARHKGSSYGAIGQLPQVSSEYFENELFDAWRQLDPARRIWLEDESRTIGTCFIPYPLWLQMQAAPTVVVEVPRHERIARLVREYSGEGIEPAALIEATRRIQKRLGGKATQEAIDAITTRDYATVADIALSYYDKSYLTGLSLKKSTDLYTFDAPTDNPSLSATQLIQLKAERN
ncbi:tRNA 2-selenouridine(34) synthase MnmH [Arsenicibacter rosenii]|uniref:tRNA 2-selenouridine(34) synthase MnmH n=1 Tax=Arsenicibacter rosenii TaxID=1750698 RepID=A0A1S2VIR4_9BACT|nr:tRNA 2-selenouridine(34) synthase MnmH [Arsenicibacter rosenii]OIN57738.1 tRNA 2-selenouridine(34) synthase MnmH [Arsenicibacter rosenii]